MDYGYDPRPPTASVANGDWCNDLKNTLWPTAKVQTQPLALRISTIVNGNANVLAYYQAFSAWAAIGVTDIGVPLVSDFFSNGRAPNNAFTGWAPPWDNGYTGAFASQVQSFVYSLALNVPLRAVWIWNEPNISLVNPGDPTTDSSLAPQEFAALLYLSYAAAKSAGAATVLAGSLSLLPGTDPYGPRGRQYMNAVCDYLGQNGVNASTGFSWDGWSVNIENRVDQSDGYARTVVEMMRQTMANHGDSGKLLVLGEWGCANDITNSIAGAMWSQFTSMQPNPRPPFDRMYFYAHQLDPANNFGTRRWQILNGYYEPDTSPPRPTWLSGLQSVWQQ